MRCTACATPGSEWAAYCSSCGASLDDALTIPNDAPIARQRRLAAGGHIARPAALSAAAIAGVIALVAVTAQLGGPRTAPPLGPHRLLYADSNQTMVSTLDGRLVADLSGWAAPGYPERAVTVGGAAFFVHDRTAWMVRSPFTAPPRALGPASHIFSAGARAVGLDNVVGSGPTMVVVRSTSGRAIGHPSTLPPNTQAVAGYGHRLLLQVGGADLEVWDTAGRKVVRHLGHTLGEVQGLIASHNSTVAWTSAGLCDATERCEIGVDDLVTGASHTVAPPLGHRSFSGEGAISPDGRLPGLLRVHRRRHGPPGHRPPGQRAHRCARTGARDGPGPQRRGVDLRRGLAAAGRPRRPALRLQRRPPDDGGPAARA